MMQSNLQTNRSTIVYCKQLVNCERCTGDPSFVKLLMTLCEKLADSYEKLRVQITQCTSKSKGQIWDSNMDILESSFSTIGGAETSPPPIPTRRAESPKYGKYICDQEGTEAGLSGVASSIELPGYEMVQEEQFLMFEAMIKMHLSMLLEVLQEVENILAGPVWSSHSKLVQKVRLQVQGHID